MSQAALLGRCTSRDWGRSRTPPTTRSWSKVARWDCSPRQLFPGGVEVDGSGGTRTSDPHHTRASREPGGVRAIFEGPAFEHGGVLVRVDMLQRRRDNRWRLLEVNRPPTSRSIIWMTWQSKAVSFPGQGWTWHSPADARQPELCIRGRLHRHASVLSHP